MLSTLKSTVLKPALGRVGTVLATLLVSQGAASDLAHLVANGVVALGLILADFVIDWHQRKSAASKGRP